LLLGSYVFWRVILLLSFLLWLLSVLLNLTLTTLLCSLPAITHIVFLVFRSGFFLGRVFLFVQAGEEEEWMNATFKEKNGK